METRAHLVTDQDQQVVVEVRLLSVPEPIYRQLDELYGLECDKGQANVAFLNDGEVRQLLDAAQADRRTNVMQAPRMVIFNGQNSCLEIADHQFYVTSVEVSQVNGQTVYVPHNEAMPTGLQIAVHPALSADRRSVRLDLNVNQKTLQCGEVPLIPVATFITPVFEGGAVGQPIPFTQFVQQPRFDTVSLNKTLNLPDGRTAFLPGWVRKRQGTPPSRPAWSILPVLGKYYKPAKQLMEMDHVMMLVSARVILNEAEEACQPPMSMAEPTPSGGDEDQLSPEEARTLARAMSDELNKRERAHRVYVKAEQYRHKGKLDQAERCYAKVCQLCPDCYDAERAGRRLKHMTRACVPKDDSRAEEAEAVAWSKDAGPSHPTSLFQTSSNREHRVAKLLADYEQACVRGRLDEAKRLAGQALALDPTCFRKFYGAATK
jgi:hypothetical protein